MNLIAIEYEPSNARGGQERSYFDILTRLQYKGHQVTLYYVVKGNLVEKYHEAGVKTVQIPTINLYNKLSIKELFAFISSFLKFKKVTNSVIYINQIQDLPLAALLKRFKGAKKIVCHLRLPPLYGHLQKTHNQISLFAKDIDTYIVANENMREAHVEHGVPNNRIQIIPNGFNFTTSYPQKSINEEHLKLVYIGRLEDGKGVKELIHSFSAILKSFPTISLTIAGAPMNSDQEHYLAECKKISEGLQIMEYIKFVGHQTNPIEFLKDYDITIFPSTWNEPFGRVLVESIIAGVPVIARNIGATKEIIDGDLGNILFETDLQLIDCLTFVINGKYNVAEKFVYQRKMYSIDSVVFKIESTLI